MKMITLPEPTYQGEISVETAMNARASVRTYASGWLSIHQVSQLLWAAQGRREKGSGRTVPSAGALYPLEVFLVAGRIEGLFPGIYRYHPYRHSIELVLSEDHRATLAESALGQSPIAKGAASLVVAGVYERTAAKYGSRAVRYVHMEAGHAAQNIYLQAVSLDLGTVAIGAFDDESVHRVLKMREEEVPLYIMPVGKLP